LKVEALLGKVGLDEGFRIVAKSTKELMVLVVDVFSSCFKAFEKYGTIIAQGFDDAIAYAITIVREQYKEDPVKFWAIILGIVIALALIPFVMGVIKTTIIIGALLLLGVFFMRLLLPFVPMIV
jgi:hypothetical protein